MQSIPPLLLGYQVCSSMAKPVKLLLTRLMSFALLLLAAAAPVQPQVRLSVTYNDAADLFSLMDNVSGWLDGFTDPAYRSEWVQRSDGPWPIKLGSLAIASTGSEPS